MTATALARAALERIDDPSGEGARSFTRIYREAALAAASESDRRLASGEARALEGLPLSIKDLFDVAGETTLAGSVVLQGAAPAAADAVIVRRLRAGGAVILGKTNMTEFAYSGLGLNPHYGTPANPFDPARVPGGSSAGAGAAVAYGFCAGSIGTDTGGSVRIPAAFCGLTGFKPTQKAVPLDGAFLLSASLDSIGPLACRVADCALLHGILAGETRPSPPACPSVRGMRFLLPANSVLTDRLDPEVARAFAASLARLSAAGAEITERSSPALALLPAIAALGGVAPPEALSVHRSLLAAGAGRYDPRVRVRLEAAAATLAVDYLEARARRDQAIRAFDAETAPFDAVICPTVAVLPPRFDALVEDAAYAAMNGLVLRNTAAFNMLDRCALSLPCHEPGRLPVGLMLVGETGGDRRLLETGCAVERALDRR